MAYVCAYVREKFMFEVYGGESESMSDQWKFFFESFIKHIAFRRMTASILAFLVIYRPHALTSRSGRQVRESGT